MLNELLGRHARSQWDNRASRTNQMSTKLPKQVLESADITAIIQLILRERKAGTWGGDVKLLV